VPVRLELIEATASLARRLQAAERRLVGERAQRLLAFKRLLASPDRALATPRQRRDLAQERLRAALRTGLDRRRLRLARAAHVLARHSPQAELARAGERLKGLAMRLRQGLRARVALEKHQRAFAAQRLAAATLRLRQALAARLEERRSRLAQLEQFRCSLGHKAVLARGFALARDEAGVLVRSASAVAPGQRLELEFSDGKRWVKAMDDAASGGAASPRRARAPKPAKGEQGSLF
jgi:exodeoxyribonuclease VII large subunit